MTITMEGALFCMQCCRYRLFRYVEQRVVEHVTLTRVEQRMTCRVWGLFYACATCGHEQQWGCAG